MKVLVIGGNGFIGRHVVAEARNQGHDVVAAYRQSAEFPIDLLDESSIALVLATARPEAIFSAAGVLSGNVHQNPLFTANLLRAVRSSKGHVGRIVISGSAAEYGLIHSKDLPVKETLPVNPVTDYGKSKAEETSLALELGREWGLPVTVARIFNPIGRGMQPRFLTSRILQQVQECTAGTRSHLEIGRRDARRDYIDVRDLSRAIVALLAGGPTHDIYNVGSGRVATNGQLLDLFVQHSHLPTKPAIIETQAHPEPAVASQADITRLRQDFGWQPLYSLEETVKDIINDTRRQ